MMRWLRKPEKRGPSKHKHRQAVVSHMELVQQALAGQREYLLLLAQMRQTSPVGHDPSEPIPIKADDDG
jgi:hypothetical protein